MLSNMSGIGTSKQPASDILVKMSGGIVVLAVVIGVLCALTQAIPGIISAIIIGGIGLIMGLVGMAMHAFSR